jgi:hypothetical protein
MYDKVFAEELLHPFGRHPRSDETDNPVEVHNTDGAGGGVGDTGGILMPQLKLR